jgi:hypothetical protein
MIDDDDDDDECGTIGGMRIGRENRSTRRKTYPSATLSTTNSIWQGQGSNPGRRGRKSMSNRLSYGSARANESVKQEIIRALLAVCFTPVSRTAFCSFSMMEPIFSSYTSLNFNGIYGVISQKTKLFIKILNLEGAESLIVILCQCWRRRWWWWWPYGRSK